MKYFGLEEPPRSLSVKKGSGSRDLYWLRYESKVPETTTMSDRAYALVPGIGLGILLSYLAIQRVTREKRSKRSGPEGA